MVASKFLFLILSLVPNIAFAADDVPTAKNAFMSFVPLIAIFGVFYLFIVRPQQRKAKEFDQMLDNLKIGTKVVTTGGIIGIIKEIDKEKDLFTITISDGVSVLLYKKSVSSVFDEDTSKKAS